MRRYALTDEPWEKIKEGLAGSEGDVGRTVKDIDYLLKRYYTGTERGAHGGICRKDSETIEVCINV